MGFRQTLANFGQPMSNERLIFAALLEVPLSQCLGLGLPHLICSIVLFADGENTITYLQVMFWNQYYGNVKFQHDYRKVHSHL